MKNIHQCKVCFKTFSLLRYLRKHVTIPAVGDQQPNKCQSYYSGTSNFQANLQVNPKGVTEKGPTDELNSDAKEQRVQLISTSNQEKTGYSKDDDCKNIEDEIACLKFEPDEGDALYFFNQEKTVSLRNDTTNNFFQKFVDNEGRPKKDNHERISIGDKEQDGAPIQQTISQLQNSQNCYIGVDVLDLNTRKINSPAETTTCKECKLVCKSLANLCFHYETFHKLPVISLARVTTNKIKLKCKQTETANRKEANRKTKTRQCDICSKTFTTVESLKAHKLSIHNTLKYNCDVCQDSFKGLQGLKRHKRHLHDHMGFKCDNCPKKFSTARYLGLHKAAIHEGVRYKCDVCEKQFCYQNNLLKHKLSIHEGVRYKCDMCEKQFLYRQNLTHHKSIHDGVCFKCNICEKRFRYKRNLEKHKASSHDGVHYKCDMCDQQFLSKKSLKEHESRSHGRFPHKCDICDKQFRSRKSVTRHTLSSHDGVRYKCELCEKQFRQVTHLKVHKASSHEIVRYKCDTCPKQFFYMSSLRKHNLAKHSAQ